MMNDHQFDNFNDITSEIANNSNKSNLGQKQF